MMGIGMYMYDGIIRFMIIMFRLAYRVNNINEFTLNKNLMKYMPPIARKYIR